MGCKVHGLPPRRRCGSRSHTAQDQDPAQLGTEESSAQAKHTPSFVPQEIRTTKVTAGTNSSPSLRQVKILSGAARDRATERLQHRSRVHPGHQATYQLKTGVHLEPPVRKPERLRIRLGTDTPTTELRPRMGTCT